MSNAKNIAIDGNFDGPDTGDWHVIAISQRDVAMREGSIRREGGIVRPHMIRSPGVSNED